MRLGGAAFRHLLGWGLSVGLHVMLVAPFVAWQFANFELDSPGEESDNDGPVGNGGGDVPPQLALVEPPAPVQVSVYEGPPTRPAPTEAPPTEAPPPPKQKATPSTAAPAADGAKTGAEDGTPGGEAKKEGVQGRPPRGKRKPCEPIDEIVQVNDSKWKVERDVVDWYATHIRELEKQAGIGVHHNAKGDRDGAKLYLPRCSILKQAGFKNGDIIRTVNGREVFTIAQGIKVYLKLRNSRNVTVELTRKGGENYTFKYRLN